MKLFLKILRTFFVILGILFLFIILSVVYLYQTDFYGIKTIINSEKNINDSGENNKVLDDAKASVSQNKNTETVLSSEQEKRLIEAGIDPDAVPSKITPEMKDCFIEKIGEDRVREIESGSNPSTIEMIKAGSCL